MKNLPIVSVLILIVGSAALTLLPGCASADKKADAAASESEKSAPADNDNDSAKTSKKDKLAKTEDTDDSAGDEKQDDAAKKKKKIVRYDGRKYIGPAQDAFKKGMSTYFSDGCEAAIPRWKEAMKEDPHSNIAFNIALCYERSNERKKSGRWYLRSFELDPKFSKPLYNMAIMDRRAETLNRDFYRKQIEKCTDPVAKFNFIAWLQLITGDLKKAESAAKKVIKEDEKNVDAVVTLAEIYFRRDMVALAKMALKTAEQWDENNFRLQRLFGIIEMKRDNEKKAVKHLKKAKSINPELPEVSNLLAVLSMKIEEWDEARKELEFALKLAPEFRAAKLNLAIAYKGVGKYKKSRDIFVELLERYKKEKNNEMLRKIYYDLGILYLDADVAGAKRPERYDNAVDYLDAFLKYVGKRERGVRKKIAEYKKEAMIGRKKLEFYWKMKKRREARKKKLEEERKKWFKRKEAAYKKAKETDTVEEYEKFLKLYPTDVEDLQELSVAADKRYRELIAIQKKKAFKEAKKTDTLAEWQAFVTAYPVPETAEKDDMTVFARKRIEALTPKEEETIEEGKSGDQKDGAMGNESTQEPPPEKLEAFKKAGEINTVAAWESFLETYPPQGDDDRFARFAVTQIQKLKAVAAEQKKQRETEKKPEKVKKKEEKKETSEEKGSQNTGGGEPSPEKLAAFRAAGKTDTIEAWTAFMKDFPVQGPDDRIGQFAKKRREELQTKKEKK